MYIDYCEFHKKHKRLFPRQRIIELNVEGEQSYLHLDQHIQSNHNSEKDNHVVYKCDQKLSDKPSQLGKRDNVDRSDKETPW